MQHFKEHMQCLSIKNQFTEQAIVLNRLLDVCVKAVKELKSSKRFTKLLTVILKMGNFMNGGSRRGGAFGIKLDVLNKIETAKSKSGKFTLVHYLVQQLIDIDADALKVEEGKCLKEISFFSFSFFLCCINCINFFLWYRFFFLFFFLQIYVLVVMQRNTQLVNCKVILPSYAKV